MASRRNIGQGLRGSMSWAGIMRPNKGKTEILYLSIDRIWNELGQKSCMFLLDIKSSPSPNGKGKI